MRGEEAHGGMVLGRAVMHHVGVSALVQAVLLLLVHLAEVRLDAPLQRRVEVVTRPDESRLVAGDIPHIVLPQHLTRLLVE